MTAFALVPYDAAWAIRGDELRADIARRIGPLARRVEHIGSTAIPGMAAKPVFDMQVSVDDLEQAAPVIDRALEPLGLVRARWEADHVPAGSPDSPDLWVKRLWNKPEPGGERLIVHCRLVSSPNERLALLFRDWFRAKPEFVAPYARFKQILAAAVDDLETYTDVKDPVVDLVVGFAEDWAAATGWRP